VKREVDGGLETVKLALPADRHHRLAPERAALCQPAQHHEGQVEAARQQDARRLRRRHRPAPQDAQGREPPVRSAGIKVPMSMRSSPSSRKWESPDVQDVLVLGRTRQRLRVKDATLAAVTAASQLGEVTALVAGAGCDGAAHAAAQDRRRCKVLKADDAAYANALAENVAPLVAGLMADYDAFVAPATTTARTSPRASPPARCDAESPTSSRSKAPRPSPVRSMPATPSPRSKAATPSW
jgi:hypothetical protein